MYFYTVLQILKDEMKKNVSCLVLSSIRQITKIYIYV